VNTVTNLRVLVPRSYLICVWSSSSSSYGSTAQIGPWPTLLVFRNNNPFTGTGLLVQRPTPNLEDQVSVFMTPGDRVAQLYPQTLGTHFSRLLEHAWVAVTGWCMVSTDLF
jgi:hypothetical protein